MRLAVRLGVGIAVVATMLAAGAATASATTNRLTYTSYVGTYTATCTTDVCGPGAPTITSLDGVASGCVGDLCATVPSSASAAVVFDYVGHPPSPCNANKVAGSLTLTPTDPKYPPDPIIVGLTGHLLDSKSVVLTGDIPPDTVYPPQPIKVAVTPTFPPSPCVTGTGTFTGTIAIG
jgi:hypothetical protein